MNHRRLDYHAPRPRIKRVVTKLEHYRSLTGGLELFTGAFFVDMGVLGGLALDRRGYDQAFLAGAAAVLLGVLMMIRSRSHIQWWRPLYAAVTAATIAAPIMIGLPLVARISANPTRRTIANIFTLASAIEARHFATNEYPDARNMKELRAALEPTYIREPPLRDGWGHSFRYQRIGNEYRIASAGSDGDWENNDLRAYRPRVFDNRESDIVYADGRFIRYQSGMEGLLPPPRRR
jgi:hypothetical protein